LNPSCISPYIIKLIKCLLFFKKSLCKHMPHLLVSFPIQSSPSYSNLQKVQFLLLPFIYNQISIPPFSWHFSNQDD
jgi:hypothetical protein